MIVWHLVSVPDSLTYTIVKALTEGGHDVVVRAAGGRRDAPPPDAIQRRLLETPGVQLMEADAAAPPSEIERLVVQVFPRPAESLAAVPRLVGRARAITLITAGDRSRPCRDALRLQWQEVKRLLRAGPRIDRVLYKDGFYPCDLLGWLRPRSVVGFDVHSQFLHELALFEAMHARDWQPESPRPIRVSFLGSQDPAPRKRILDTVRALFEGSSAGGKTNRLFWHEYSDAAPVGVAPLEFVRLLTQSDFTLCPRGYSLITHRPMEALLRGSIPVLAADEIDLYGVDLVDGRNCIAVPAGRWAETVRSLATMDEEAIVRMRRTVQSLFEDCLRYEALSRRLRERIGVVDDRGQLDRTRPSEQGYRCATLP